MSSSSSSSSTESLRRDHQLIEKMLRALDATAGLLRQGKAIPAPILDQTIDFVRNFTNVCHHGKEEESLFPSLERGGMPREGGPIVRMLFEHEVTKQLADRLDKSAKAYLESGSADALVADIKGYIDHVGLHLGKENYRLFVMADMILQARAGQVTEELAAVEESKLRAVGKTRNDYESMVQNIEAQVARQVQGQ